jgi:hypothetical protein
MRAVIWSVLFFCAAAVAGCEDDMANSDDPAFFESPRQAVEAITVMLEAKDWPALARYYDLEGSDIDRAQLVSGEFFYRTKRPEVSHPAFWRYKHPFSPGFHYAWSASEVDLAIMLAPPEDAPGAVTAAPEGDPDIVKVVLEVEVDQGTGLPVQRGRSEFRMRKSERGYQVLPPG